MIWVARCSRAYERVTQTRIDALLGASDTSFALRRAVADARVGRARDPQRNILCVPWCDVRSISFFLRNHAQMETGACRGACLNRFSVGVLEIAVNFCVPKPLICWSTQAEHV